MSPATASPAATPRTAALVLNWRLPEVTLQCLRDLAACDYPALDVLVMDNGSGDGSAERFAREAKGAALLAFDKNLGYCAAMNKGLAWARERGAELVLFVNNDLRAPRDFLAPMVEVLVHDERVAGVTPTILRPDGRVWCAGGAIAFHPNMLKLLGEGQAPAPVTAGPEAVDFLTGACALYRLSALEAVGDLDESYFMYWEDVELGHRLRAGGGVLLWLPWTRVTHLSSASSGGGRSEMRKFISAVNSVRYLKRHGTLRQWLAFFVFDCALWPVTPLGGTGWRAALAKARGIAAGWRGHRVTVQDVLRFQPKG
jgi:GT2 family glycosyltransferase